MKRSFALWGATTAGFAGVIALHGPTNQTLSIAQASKATTPAPKSATTSSSPSSASPSTTLAASATKTTVAPPSTASSAKETAIGQQENYGYGQMSVKVTISNNRIVNVAVNSIQALESYSLQLEQQVVPILKSEVLSAQSANISSLSGATYTSEAYAYSLQSALDQLHFK